VTAPPSPAPLPTARSTSDVMLPNISVLYLGPPKSGKTTCALSWPAPFVFYSEPNLAGLLGTADVPYLTVDDMSPEPITALQQRILPAIANGRIKELSGGREVHTLVFDSLTVFLDILMRKIAGNQPMKGYDQYGQFLYQAENLINGQLTPLVRRGFNVVCTCHIGDYGNDNEPTTRRPAVTGKLRNILCSRFDTVLLTGSEMVPEKDAKGGLTGKRFADYFVNTINPDRSYEGIGDGLGRQGGRFKPLPPRLDGRYPSLAAAWGLKS